MENKELDRVMDMTSQFVGALAAFTTQLGSLGNKIGNVEAGFNKLSSQVKFYGTEINRVEKEARHRDVRGIKMFIALCSCMTVIMIVLAVVILSKIS